MFKVKNYTSFKNESILDMRATAYVQHPNHVIHVNDKLGLLKATALYGANASGKSNFISAMFFFTMKHNLLGSQKSADCPYQTKKG